MKSLVLILHCTLQPGKAIKYSFAGNTDYYIIYNFDLLLGYVGKLLGRYEHISVVLIYKQLAATLDAVKLLYNSSDSEKATEALGRYKQQYKKELALATANTKNGALNTDFEVKLPQGHADRAIGYELFVVFDVSHVEDHLLEENTGIQQLLRYIALKHGAYYGALSGKLEELENPDTCQILLLSLRGDLKEAERHIFASKGENVTDNIELHQRLALGWDLWNKIQIIAKLIVRREDWSLLDLEVKMEELDDIYEEFLKGDEEAFLSRAKALVGIEEDPEVVPLPPPLTYKDFVKKMQAVLQK